MIIKYREVAILAATINLKSGGVYTDIFTKVLLIFTSERKQKNSVLRINY